MKSKMLCALLALTLALTLGSVSSFAANYSILGPSVIYQNASDPIDNNDYTYSIAGLPAGMILSPSDVSLSNPGTVAHVYTETTNRHHVYFMPDDVTCTAKIVLRPWTPGKTVLSVNLGEETISEEITVLPYTRPIKTFKITGVNSGKNLASQFKKNAFINAPLLTKSVSSGKFYVKAASGWAITGMSITMGEAEEITTQSVGYQTKKTKGTLKFSSLKKNQSYTFNASFRNLTTNGTLSLTYHLTSSVS